jgi:endonuclease/exonuclease/phosphatase (EEP) superfamily protein YafD
MFVVEAISSQLAYKLLVVVLAAIFLLTIASLFGNHLYLELTTHFRIQYALGAVLCGVLLLNFHSPRLVPIAVFCAVFNLAYLGPYYLSFKQPQMQSARAQLRLMHANVLMTNQNYRVLLDAVNEANADVVVLQELTEEWRENTQVLTEKYPFFELAPRPGGSGMGLFSRYPLADVQTLTLDTSGHLALMARANVGGASVTILALHPPTPISPARFANRNLQFKEAASLLRAVDGPRILIGDLNTTMWSPYFEDLEHNTGLRDARLGFGLKPSWPMPLPGFMRLPIDHCLVSNEVVVEGIRTGRRIGSDHRPLIVDLQLPLP